MLIGSATEVVNRAIHVGMINYRYGLMVEVRGVAVKAVNVSGGFCLVLHPRTGKPGKEGRL